MAIARATQQQTAKQLTWNSARSWQAAAQGWGLRLVLATLAMLPSAVANARPETIPTPGIPNGTYIYGSVEQPDEIGQEYFVFEARNNYLLGTFYYPRSEFSCFYGRVGTRQLSLTVIDPYSNESHPYAIAFAPVALAAGEDAAAIGLEGYHRLSSLSVNDRRMLDTCIGEHQQDVWQKTIVKHI
ncbi:hypothetical protein KR51_00017420 [Rubidibacter lacunae KORDI 51-2]|uniref:Uncharacterized protein n=1 Tax=Rubidibacter lacunae KORDI 51-2 TaxID=582515 RepID=U5DAU0_9CHRO|nr:hypothetical protein [Rubidibacter lacunae]ERN41663.1 hypothetical protein KR51_00017420 [Rubidibacter lacunae KORDI 51-2]